MNFKFSSIAMLIILGLTFFSHKAYTQEEKEVIYPKVGDTIQDHTFIDLYNYPQSTLKLSDLRGKWVILDIWSKSCGGCIASFPKMSALSERFKDRVQVIMVGSYNSEERGIRTQTYQKTKEVYEYYKKLHNLKFTVALDSKLTGKYDVFSVPMIFIINPEGVILAKTTSVNEQQINNLLTSKPVYFSRAFSKHEKIEYDNKLPFLTTGSFANGGVDTSFVFRSLLGKYNYNVPLIVGNLREDMAASNTALKTGRFEVTKLSLEQLLKLAYFGQTALDIYHPHKQIVSPKIILEVKDSRIFESDNATLSGLYSYSLTVPKEIVSIVYFKKIMRQDLSRYFGISVSIEERLVPHYELRIVDSSKAVLLKTKGKEPTFYYGQNEYGRFRFENQDPSELLYSIINSISSQRMPLIDKSGIDYNIDIDMRADPYNLASINKGLEKYGLKVVTTENLISTIVVRD